MRALRPVQYAKLVKVFEQDGFNFDRQRGDHLIYTKPGLIRPLVIPIYDQVPVFIIKNLLRTAGMSRERYFELLQSV
jgi:predicted RNA binding protein YcfA (HicA-like mRNA interferase family)